MYPEGLGRARVKRRASIAPLWCYGLIGVACHAGKPQQNSCFRVCRKLAVVMAPAGCRVALLNDFEAVGYGIPVLGPHDVVPLNDVPVQPKVRGGREQEQGVEVRRWW